MSHDVTSSPGTTVARLGERIKAAATRRAGPARGAGSALRIEHGSATCAKHGPYTYEGRRVGTVVVGDTCPQCMSLNFAWAAQDNADRQARESAREIAEKLRLANIPEGFRNATFENYYPGSRLAGDVVANLIGYADHFDKMIAQTPAQGVLLTGTPGSGKTHLACATLHRLAGRGYSVGYASIPSLLLALQDARSGSSRRGVSSLLAETTAPDFAVLDELGIASERDVDYQLVFALIDERYAHNRPTLLISNFSHDQLVDKFGPRLIERVRGKKGAYVRCTWPSYRAVAA